MGQPIGYRSDHDKWWDLEKHKTTEEELGNPFPDISNYPNHEAIWVCHNEEDALRCGDATYEVDLTGAKIVHTDDEGGHLYARPKRKRINEKTEKKEKILAVDVDDTIAKQEKTDDFDVTEFGEPFPDAIETLQTLKRNGWKIILHSCRTSPTANPGYSTAALKTNLAMWANENGIPYDDVWVNEGKPLAAVYLDDKGMKFNGDWKAVGDELEGFE